MSIAAALIPGPASAKAPLAWKRLLWRSLIIALKLFISLSLMTDICAIAWQYQMAAKYSHGDNDAPIPLDFLNPGLWVQEDAVTVPKLTATVHTDVNGDVHDQILEGWTVPRLWRYWWAYLALDISAALVLATLPWRATLVGFMRLTHFPDALSPMLLIPLAILISIALIPAGALLFFLLLIFLLNLLR